MKIKFTSLVKPSATILLLIFFNQTINAQWVQTSGPEGITVKKIFDNDSVLFAGTSAKGAFKSYDHGLTWLASNIGIENQEVFSFERDLLYVYAGTENGVYRSADNGATWTAANTGIQAQFINCMVRAGSFLFAGTIGAGVYSSVNNGNSWIDANAGSLNSSYIKAICYSDTNLIVEADNYVWKSSDFGISWNLDQGTTQFYPINNFIVKGDTVLASAYGGIFYSYDAGNNWSNNITVNPNFDIIGFALSNDTLFTGSQNGMYRSTDYGMTWVFISNSGLRFGNRFHNHFAKSGQNYLLGMDELGVFLSLDNGATWNQSANGFSPASTEDNSMITVGNDLITGTHSNGVHKTTDNGITWNKIGTSAPLDTLSNSIVFAMLNPAPNILIAAACDYGLYRSGDNGATWTHITSGLPPLSSSTCINGLAKSATNVLASTSDGLYYSSDNGLTWNLSNIPSTYDVGCVSANGNIVCAGVSAGTSAQSGIYRSTNNGVSFTQTNNILDAICMAADGGNYFYVGTFAGNFYSPDNGLTWLGTGPGIPSGDAGFSILAIGANVFIGNNNGIYFSSNHAASFTSVNQGFDPYPNNSVQGLAANNSFIFAGTFRDAVWRRPLSDFGITLVIAENENADRQNLTGYPNPAQKYFVIDLPGKNNFDITISDATGRKIFEEKNISGLSQIDCKSFPDGVYVIRAAGNNENILFQKLIIQN